MTCCHQRPVLFVTEFVNLHVPSTGVKVVKSKFHSNRLSKLDVSDNGIGEAGGIDLGFMIANAKSLKQADFSCSLAAERTHPLGHAPSPLAIDAH